MPSPRNLCISYLTPFISTYITSEPPWSLTKPFFSSMKIFVGNHSILLLIFFYCYHDSRPITNHITWYISWLHYSVYNINVSEISFFYTIGCLLLISCHLLMTHSMSFYVILYLLLSIVEITYRYKQSCMYIRPALTAVSITRTLMSSSYKHPQFSKALSKLLTLYHYPQAYTLWVSHRVPYSSYLSVHHQT